MDENHKREQAQKHIKQAGRSARRKEREGYSSRPDKDLDQGRGANRDEQGWENERPRRQKRKRARKPAQLTRSLPSDSAQIISISRGHARVRLDKNQSEQLASIAPALRGVALVVGDKVRVRPGESARIESLLPRRNLLSRPDVGNRHRELPIAANLDLGVIVAACVSPPLRPGLIDRYLIALERAGVAPVLCINKIDLCQTTEQQIQLEQALDPYRELALPIVFASAEKGAGTAELAKLLAAQTVVLVGHSGVGKSSLLGALGAPHASAVPGAVREHDGRGRHTTSSSTLQRLPGNIRLIDTPGVRAFGLWGISAQELSEHFPGFGELPAGCHFRNCAHMQEPDCAVRGAVEAGRLAKSRYKIYQRLFAELTS